MTDANMLVTLKLYCSNTHDVVTHRIYTIINIIQMVNRNNAHIITTYMNMCACIAEPQHIYIRSDEITASVIKFMNVRMRTKTMMKHCMAMHCNIFAVRLIKFQTNSECIHSRAIAYFAMHYISNE